MQGALRRLGREKIDFIFDPDFFIRQTPSHSVLGRVFAKGVLAGTAQDFLQPGSEDCQCMITLCHCSEENKGFGHAKFRCVSKVQLKFWFSGGQTQHWIVL